MSRTTFGFLIGIAACCVGTADAAPKGVALRGNPGVFFGPDSYPVEAIRLGQQGRVVARLQIDASGHVAACTIEQTSKSPSLDQRTCEIALQKIVFEPARDEKGRPIGAVYHLPVRWILPSGPIDVTAAPPPKVSMDMTMSIDSDGTVSACNATVVPEPLDGTNPCDQYPVGKSTELGWMRNGKRVGGVIHRHYSEETTVDP